VVLVVLDELLVGRSPVGAHVGHVVVERPDELVLDAVDPRDGSVEVGLALLAEFVGRSVVQQVRGDGLDAPLVRGRDERARTPGTVEYRLALPRREVQFEDAFVLLGGTTDEGDVVYLVPIRTAQSNYASVRVYKINLANTSVFSSWNGSSGGYGRVIRAYPG
jgi:hypothetical protein